MPTTYPTRAAAQAAAIASGIHPEMANTYIVVQGRKTSFAYEALDGSTFVQASDPAPEAPQPDVAPRTYKRPKSGVCADVWNWCDATQPTSAAQVRAVAPSKGWNLNNCVTEYYGWRRAGMH